MADAQRMLQFRQLSPLWLHCRGRQHEILQSGYGFKVFQFNHIELIVLLYSTISFGSII